MATLLRLATSRTYTTSWGITDEPGVQPAFTCVKGRCMALVIGTAARAQRVASAHKRFLC